MRSERFAASVGKVAGGAAAGQVALLVALSLATAVYEPEALGALGLVASVAAIGEVVLGLRLDLALPVCADDQAFSRLAGTVEYQARRGLRIGFVIAAVVVVSAALAGDRSWFGDPGSAVVGLAVVASASALTMDARVLMAVRNRSFGTVGRAQAVAGVTQGVVLMGAGLLSASPFVAAGSFVVARLVAANLVLKTQLPMESTSHRLPLRDAAVEYSDFVRFSMPTGLVNSINLAAPIMFFAATFDLAAAGVFFVVWRLLMGPAQLLGRAIGQVVYGETAAALSGSDVRTQTVLSLRRSVPLGLAVLAAAAACRLANVHQLVGDEWIAAGGFLVPVGTMAAVQLATSPVRNVLTRLGRQRLLLLLQLGRLALTGVAALGSLVLALTEVATIWLFAASLVCSNVLVLVSTLRTLSSGDADAEAVEQS